MKTENSNTASAGVTQEDKARTWGEKNGGMILGIAVFGILGLATFLMWLANNV
jgi:hypothetical protein